LGDENTKRAALGILIVAAVPFSAQANEIHVCDAEFWAISIPSVSSHVCGNATKMKFLNSENGSTKFEYKFDKIG
jgi:hypothetical protein